MKRVCGYVTHAVKEEGKEVVCVRVCVCMCGGVKPIYQADIGLSIKIGKWPVSIDYH